MLPAHTAMLTGSMNCAMDPLWARFAVGKSFKFRGVTHTVAHSPSCIGNMLRGMLPATCPTSMTRLDVEHNPELAGKISRELVLQCSRGIMYYHCKKDYEAKKQR